MEPTDYLKIIEDVFARDKALILHYKKLQCNDRYAFILERMKLTKQEMDSIKQMLEGGDEDEEEEEDDEHGEHGVMMDGNLEDE